MDFGLWENYYKKILDDFGFEREDDDVGLSCHPIRYAGSQRSISAIETTVSCFMFFI